MIIRLPQNKTFTQPNQGNIFGDLWATFGIDLISSKGKIRISPKTTVSYSNVAGDNGDADFVYPVALVTGNFVGVNDKLRTWIICDKYVFKTTAIDSQGRPQYGTCVQDDIANSPSDLSHIYSDATEFNGSLITSVSADLHKLTAGTWTKNWWTGAGNLNQAALSGSIPHPLGKGFNNLLLVGDGHYVHTIDITDTVDTVLLNFPSEFQVQWIKSSSTMIYFGCRNINGGRAKVFAWDGSSENFNYAYVLNGSESFAGIIKDEIPYTIDERGELTALSGSSFTQVATLPVFNTDYNLSSNWTYPVNVCRNGMAVQDNRIHILVQGSVGSSDFSHIENQLSGVWCFDPDIGLFHRYTVTKGGITGASVTDYGSGIIKKAGALMTIDKTLGSLLIACSLYVADGSSTTTVRHTLQVILNNETYESGSSSTRRGYFITPEILTNQLEESWTNIFFILKEILNSTTRLVVKYRTYIADLGNYGYPSLGLLGTWTSSTTFTSTSDLSDVQVGDEVEVLSGFGSGLLTHVTVISENAGTYTVTIDETLTSATGTAMFRFFRWKKLTENTLQNLTYQDFILSINSPWIQFKVYGISSDKALEIEQIIIKSQTQTTIE